jgi:hypothetical protein
VPCVDLLALGLASIMALTCGSHTAHAASCQPVHVCTLLCGVLCCWKSMTPLPCAINFYCCSHGDPTKPQLGCPAPQRHAGGCLSSSAPTAIVSAAAAAQQAVEPTQFPYSSAKRAARACHTGASFLFLEANTAMLYASITSIYSSSSSSNGGSSKSTAEMRPLALIAGCCTMT